MQRFGQYIPVQLLSPTATGAVYTARGSGEPESVPPSVVVKVFVPDRRIMTAAEAEKQLERFLVAAEFQREQSAGGEWSKAAGAGLVRVLEVGRFNADDGAGGYVVMERAARGSCRRLMAGVRRIDGPGLTNIVRQAALALRQLHAAATPRAHGNLRADNVLLMNDAPAASVQVKLSDPVSSAAAESMGPRGLVRDLRDLGELVYGLVMRREYNGDWPVADGPAWQAMGPAGSKWLQLCNVLLDRRLEAASPAFTIDQVLESIPAAPMPRPRWVIPAAAVLLVALIASAVVLLSGGRAATIEDFSQVKQASDEQIATMLEDWAELVRVHEPRQGWVDVLYRLSGDRRAPTDAKLDAAELELRSRLTAKAPTVLSRAAELIKPELRPSMIRAEWPRNEDLPELNVPAAGQDRAKDVQAIRDLSPERRLEFKNWWFVSNYAMDRTRPAIAAVRELTAYFGEGEQWPPRRQIQALIDAAGQPESALVTAMRAELTEVSVQLAGGGREALSAIAELAELGAAAERLTAAARGLQTAKSRAAADATTQRIARDWPALWGARDGQAAPAATVLQLAELLERVSRAADAPAIAADDLHALLEAQGLMSLAGNGADVLDVRAVQDWLAIRTGEHPGVEARKRLAEVDAGIQTLLATGCKMAAAPAELAAARAELAAQVQQLIARRWTQAGASGLGEAAKPMRQAADALQADLRTRTAQADAEARRLASTLDRELREFVPPEELGSEAIGAALKARLAALADRSTLGACEKASERDAWVAVFRRFAADVGPGRAVAAETTGWLSRLRSQVVAERERAMTKALASLTWTDQAAAHADQLAALATATKSSLATAQDQLEELIADLQRFDQRLVRDGGLGEAGGDSAAAMWAKATQNPRWSEPGVRESVAELSMRRDQHQRITELSDADELKALISDTAAAADVRAAAWTRLASDAVTGWPNSAQELSPAPSLIEPLRSAIDEPSRSAIAPRLASAKTSAWLKLVKRLTTGNSERDKRAVELQSVLELAEKFEVPPSQWPPRVQLAGELARLKQALGGIADRGGDVDAQVDALWNPLKSRVASMQLDNTARTAWAALEREVDREIADVRGGIKFEELGPGTKGAPVKALDRGAKLEFTLAGQPVMFHQLKVGDVYWYIAETEVSIKLFGDVLKERRAFANAVAEGWLLAEPDLLGARGWVVRGDALAAAPAWIVSKPGYTTEPAFVGGRGVRLPEALGSEPSADMPMHRIGHAGAQAWAALVGCELPSVDAWKGALAMNAAAIGSPRPAERLMNLRDQTFERQRAHAERVRAGGSKTFDIDDFYSPDWDAYSPQGPAVAADDGVLFFRPVSQDPGGGVFKNLLGNVAELVVDGRGQMAVIGGSALSSPSRIEEPVPAEVEYAPDVGLRLAFSSATAIKPPMHEAVRATLHRRLGPVPLLLE